MGDVTVKDTAAYQIIRLITDHIWGSEEKISGSDCISICRQYYVKGGAWIKLMDGSMDDVKILEDCIENFVRSRRESSIASRVASHMFKQ